MSDWADYRQNRQIRSLQDDLSSVNASLASAHSSNRRLQSELSKVTGSIEQRLNRITAAFDAFVELSDLRMTLALFDDHARVRHRARQLFGEHPLPGELSDVDGYWLAPALLAVTDARPNSEAVRLAQTRDPRRAPLFHVLAGVLLGRPDATGLATGLVDVLPEFEADVPMYQRALWLLAADGQLTDDAKTLVLRRGTDYLARLPDAERREAAMAWRRAIKPERGDNLPSGLGPATDLINAMDACERLAVLRHWVATNLEDKPADEVDPIVQQTLGLMIDEGSPLELPLLQRERELRKIIENTTADTGDGWENPVGTVITLLRNDVDDAEHPGRRALAVRISAPLILEAADSLAEQARRTLPAQVQARGSYGPLTISKADVEQSSLDRSLVRAMASLPYTKPRRKIAYGAGAVGLVLVVLAIVAGWGWLVPAVGAFAVTGFQLWRERSDQQAARDHEARSRKKIREEADGLVAAYREGCAELDRRRLRIDEDLGALRAGLAR
jgi:hypothetical protein